MTDKILTKEQQDKIVRQKSRINELVLRLIKVTDEEMLESSVEEIVEGHFNKEYQLAQELEKPFQLNGDDTNEDN